MLRMRHARQLSKMVMLILLVGFACMAKGPDTQPVRFDELQRRIEKDPHPLLSGSAICECRIDRLSIDGDGTLHIDTTIRNVSDLPLVLLKDVLHQSPVLNMRMWAKDGQSLYCVDRNPIIIPDSGTASAMLGPGERRTMRSSCDALCKNKPIGERFMQLFRYSSVDLGSRERECVTEMPKGIYVVETEIDLYILLDGTPDREIIHVPTRNKLWYEVK